MPALAQQGNTDPKHVPRSASASSSPAVQVLPVPPLQPEGIRDGGAYARAGIQHTLHAGQFVQQQQDGITKKSHQLLQSLYLQQVPTSFPPPREKKNLPKTQTNNLNSLFVFFSSLREKMLLPNCVCNSRWTAIISTRS